MNSNPAPEAEGKTVLRLRKQKKNNNPPLEAEGKTVLRPFVMKLADLSINQAAGQVGTAALNRLNIPVYLKNPGRSHPIIW